MRVTNDYMLGFIATLTLADHEGDMLDYCKKVLSDMGYDLDWSDKYELWDQIAMMGHIKTIWGDPVEIEDDNS